MTVADNTSRNQYTATSGQTVFAYTFEIVDKGDIVVLQNGTTLSEGTNYTVSNVGNDSGGNVTLTVGATAGDILTLYRDMPYARTQNYTNSGDFLASEVNSDFDNLWLAGEQTNRSFSQSIRKPITDSDSISMELPAAADRAGKLLSFTSSGAVSTATSATNGTVSNLVTYTPAGTGAVDTTVQAKLRESISVKDFGAVGDGTTDDTAAIQAGIDYASTSKAILKIPNGTYLCQSVLILKSNCVVECDGRIETTATTDFITGTTITNAEWRGGEIVANTPTNAQSCFVIKTDSNNNLIADVSLTNFRNKGVDIQTGSYENTVQRVKVSGASGTSGSGVSIFGTGSDRPDHNKIIDCQVSNSRGGISVQGGYYNQIVNPVIYDCTLWGVGLDGVVTAAGDGARYTQISNANCNRVSSTTYGGIYLGNGSSFNIIDSPVLIDCYTGIRGSGGSGYEPSNNVITNPIIDGNVSSALGNTGINLSECDYAKIISPTIRNMSSRGLYLFSSPYSQVTGGEISNCTAEGLYLQTKECLVSGVYSHDNNYGIRIEFGGDANGTNRFTDCKVESNTTEDLRRGISTTYVKDCKGFVNSNAGTATLSSGTNVKTVTHGLDYTPTAQDINLTPYSNPNNLGAYWVSGIGATTFNISSSNTATADVDFAWQVEERQ